MYLYSTMNGTMDVMACAEGRIDERRRGRYVACEVPSGRVNAITGWRLGISSSQYQQLEV